MWCTRFSSCITQPRALLHHPRAHTLKHLKSGKCIKNIMPNQKLGPVYERYSGYACLKTYWITITKSLCLTLQTVRAVR